MKGHPLVLDERRQMLEMVMELVGIVMTWFACFLCVGWHHLMPQMIFINILGQALFFLIVYLYQMFRCDLVFYHWALWLLWALYSFGYMVQDAYVTTDVLVLIYALFAAVVHLAALLVAINKSQGVGSLLVMAFVCMLCVDMMPMPYNNAFIHDRASWPHVRMLIACAIMVLLDIVYRRLSVTRHLSRDSWLRIVLQISYIFYAHIYFVLPVAALHALYLLNNDREYLGMISLHAYYEIVKPYMARIYHGSFPRDTNKV